MPLDWKTPASIDGGPAVQRRVGLDRRTAIDRRAEVTPPAPGDEGRRALVFPGQGAQTVGMGRDLAAAFSEARQVFDEVDEAFNENLSRLIAEGPEQELTLTRNAQPALMAVSIAALRVFERICGSDIAGLCRYVAGHSLGRIDIHRIHSMQHAMWMNARK